MTALSVADLLAVLRQHRQRRRWARRDRCAHRRIEEHRRQPLVPPELGALVVGWCRSCDELVSKTVPR